MVGHRLPVGTLILHTPRAAARERGAAVFIDHRAFPLELFNRMPIPKGIVDAELVTIGALRPELGWRLWQGSEHTYPVTTLPAMEAVQAAKSPKVGGLAASDELDGALREAFYVDSACISMHSVILDVARQCAKVDHDALGAALAEGRGRAEVYRQWAVAEGPEVQGSPHLSTVDGFARHNPGANHYWTDGPPDGLPRLESYDSGWTTELLDGLASM